MALPGRQQGLHGPIEDNIIEWEMMHARHMRDGELTPDELLEGYNLNHHRNRTDSRTAHSLRTVNAILQGSDGARSPSVLRLVHSRESEPMDAA